MVYLFTLLPLPFIVGIAYLFNNKRKYKREGNIYYLSIIEGFSAYLISVAIFFEGFLSAYILSFILLIIGILIISLPSKELKIEKSKIEIRLISVQNLLIIFPTTFLLLYILLTVFRYQSSIIQISLSIGITLLANVGFFYVRRKIRKWVDQIIFKSSISFTPTLLYLGIVLAVVLLSIVLFNFPYSKLDDITNLQHHNNYLSDTSGYTNQVYHFDDELLFEATVDRNLYSIPEPYLNIQNDLVIVNFLDKNYIYDLNTEETTTLKEDITTIGTIEITNINNEIDESYIASDCEDLVNCEQRTGTYIDGIAFSAYDPLLQLENLSYNNADYGILKDDVIYLFDNNQFDSKYVLLNEKPFFEFSYHEFSTIDIDQYEGEIYIFQAVERNGQTTFKVYKVIEKDIDLQLPFYSHYSFAGLLFVVLLGFFPLTNNDNKATVISFQEQVIDKSKDKKIE